jgi:signal transduction histidine kinase
MYINPKRPSDISDKREEIHSNNNSAKMSQKQRPIPWFGLRTKFLLFTILLVIMPIMTVTFFTIKHYNSILTETYSQRQDAQLQTTMMVVENITQRLQSLARQLTIDNTLITTLRLKIYPQLSDYLERIAVSNDINTIVVYDTNKFPLASYPKGFARSLKWNKVNLHSYYFSGRKLKEAYVLPLYWKKQMLGYIELEIDLVGVEAAPQFNMLKRLKELFGDTIVLISRGDDIENAITYEQFTIGKVKKLGPSRILLNNKTYMYDKYSLQNTDETLNIYIFNSMSPLVELLSSTRNRIILVALIVVTLGLAIAMYISMSITSRIYNISGFAERIAGGVLNESIRDDRKDELGRLADSMNRMSRSLLNAKWEAEQRQKEIVEINLHLAERIEEEVKKNRERDQMMFLQSRQAAMGEMIGNIAHQWRQPLNSLGLIIQRLKDLQPSEREEIESSVYRAMEIIKHMSHTIDDFRRFFSPSREKEVFSLSETVRECLNLIDAAFRSNFIRVNLNIREDIWISGFPNEYKQVIMNILNNAKDVLKEKEGMERVIEIEIFKDRNNSVVTIRDNGGGIPEEIIDKIFEPYFTTKEPGKGSGLGLYMSKVIIESHMGGSLSVRNVDGGALFTIAAPL